MPQRIARENGAPMPPGAVYCGSGTSWANPFSHRIHGYAGAADRFRVLMEATRPGAPAGQMVAGDILRWSAKARWMWAKMPTLKGRDLADWLPIGVPSHVDVLLTLANPETP